MPDKPLTFDSGLSTGSVVSLNEKRCWVSPGKWTRTFAIPGGGGLNPHREQIEFAETADAVGVQAFYLSVEYGGGVQPDDRLLVARADHSIVGAVRLCVEHGVLVLRGMYVAEERRGLGIGTGLLASTSAAIGSSECWCIPYTRLTDFYSRIGFRVCGGDLAPTFLAERRERYTAAGRNVVVMKRPILSDQQAGRLGSAHQESIERA